MFACSVVPFWGELIVLAAERLVVEPETLVLQGEYSAVSVSDCHHQCY